ncbi:hypothetical protein K439DRAFT_1230057, partial [Ramaria rubella]
YVKKILVPYYARQKALLGLPDSQECIWQIDVWSVHHLIAFRTWMNVNYFWIITSFVPGGCTGLFQPCDVGIQRPLKISIKRTQHANIVEETLGQLQEGKSAVNIHLDTTVGILHNCSVKWLVNTYKAI